MMLRTNSELLNQLGRRCAILTKRQRTFLFSAFVLAALLLVNIFFRQDDQLPDYLPPRRTQPNDADLPPEIHPINYLITNARSEFAKVKSRQSTNLKKAVAEYRRRYGINPPPHFDKWYDFAVHNGAPLIDEYDMIHELLLPFWAFSPSALRKKAKKALGADKFVMGVSVRAGKVKSVGKGPEWKQFAIRESIETFSRFLPDMDLAFNLHDEPRVIMPHDDLDHLLAHAQQRRKTANRATSARKYWSASPKDLDEAATEPYAETPFNEYAHQLTWTVSRSSCPPDSPARSIEYDDRPMDDDLVAYTYAPLDFVQNRTAFTDICRSPSLEHKYGFFNKPNAWSVTHELLPIFSPSKLSSFQDILFPAAWYLGEKVSLDEERDIPWDEKDDLLYWRGSTTSGYSEKGIWHRQHRQRFVEQVEQPGSAHILVRREDSSLGWEIKQVDRQLFQHLYDVHFSGIGQCSPEDCASQTDYFDVREEDDFQKAWQYKYLLDIDGNAFSGRFYAFLRSQSLTLKFALFREWHEQFIAPWVHYIPLGLNGNDHLEILRYLTEEDEGKEFAREVADESMGWAGQALRKVDMQIWIFRLLLEYVHNHRTLI